MKSSTASVTVANYLVSRIEELGIKVIPVLQGGVIMKMIDEVGESKVLSYIVPNHEQALAMMVDSYARINGYGVGFTTGGPGAVNLATGIACAYYDSVPCLFITGQVGMFHSTGERNVRQRGFQETDIVSVLSPITKYAILLEKAEDARYIFEKAVYISKNGRPGPVVIDLPYNVQRSLVIPKQLQGYDPGTEAIVSQKDKNLILSNAGNALRKALPISYNHTMASANLIINKISKAKKPLLLVGGGVRISGKQEVAYRFVEKSGIPVVTTWTSADIFPRDFHLYLGNVGKSGDNVAVSAVQDCDLLVCLGSRFTPKVILNEKRFAENAEIIAVDIDCAELNEAIIDPKIVADLKSLLPDLVDATNYNLLISEEWIRTLTKMKVKLAFTPELSDKVDKYVNPFNFAEKLFQAMETDAILFADAGANLTWIMQGCKLKRGQRLISAWGNSPMGYAFPAAIGAKLAAPDQQIIATIGDGGFQMNIQELQTMFGNKIDIKLFILNNRCYGNIKMGARREFNSRVHGNDSNSGYTSPNFIKVAQAYGLQTETIDNDAEVSQKLSEILATKGALIVDVNIDPEQEHVELNI